MPLELTILTGLVGLLALLALIQPAKLFEYPVAVSMLMWFFIIPQAYKIESLGEMADYEPGTTWTYMIACVVAIFIGFSAGTSRSKSTNAQGFETLALKYDLGKVFTGACVLVGVGGVALILVGNESAKLTQKEAWTGPLAFYAMVSLLLLYGSSLSWILYLYTKSKKALILTAIGLGANLPAILFSAKREVTFTVAAVILLGVFFVRKKSINRFLLIPLLLIGAILVNQAGAIRSYISQKDTTIISAIASDEINGDDQSVNGESHNYNEVASAVSDIALARWNGTYYLISPYYNTLVQLYVPAFILGHDIKDSLKIDTGDEDENIVGTKYYAPGATRTGFSDSFLSLHFFGCFIFFFISYVMGIFWKKAINGDIMSQLYYILLLSAGLKAITESTSIFVGALPLLFGSTWAVFRYSKRKPTTQATGQNALAMPASARRR